MISLINQRVRSDIAEVVKESQFLISEQQFAVGRGSESLSYFYNNERLEHE